MVMGSRLQRCHPGSVPEGGWTWWPLGHPPRLLAEPLGATSVAQGDAAGTGLPDAARSLYRCT